MKKHIAILLAVLMIAAIDAHAQTIHAVAPRVEHVVIIDGRVTYVTDTVSLEPVFFVTKREQDSVFIIGLRELLSEDHLWLSHHVWRNDSADGIYLRKRIARNEVKLHDADSVFTVQYRNRYTSK